MRRDDTFTFRVSEAERQALAKLSERLERTQSDTLRLLIRRAGHGVRRLATEIEVFGKQDETKS